MTKVANPAKLVMAGLSGKLKGAHVHFCRHNSPNSHVLAD